jgi:acetyl esterase/lipase
MLTEDDVLDELKPILKGSPLLDLENNFEAARNLPAPVLEHTPGIVITTRKIQGAESEIYVKIYGPVSTCNDRLPALLWMHGGGYVLGSPDGEDAMCELFAEKADCIVVSADYRLAPEHPYPAAIEDCYAALRWIAASADSLHINPSRIGIGGPSAGGGLTAALALAARDRNGPAVKFQLPLYPMLDSRCGTLSANEFTMQTMPHAWNRENNRTAWDMYLGAENVKKNPPAYAVPALAEDLSGLPAAYICVGQLDPFRDEVMEYASRLAGAGVPVEFHLYPGCYHGFDAIANETPVCRRTRDEYIRAFRQGVHN